MESDWFTFTVLGVALLVGGLAPDQWGWLFGAAMAVAYVAIALRWRRVGQTFSWDRKAVSVQWLPFLISAAIGLGDWAWSELLTDPAATVAVTAWTALGLLLLWRLLQSTACLMLAGIAVAVGALQLAFDVNSAASYGVAFLAWGAIHWFWLGHRTA